MLRIISIKLEIINPIENTNSIGRISNLERCEEHLVYINKKNRENLIRLTRVITLSSGHEMENVNSFFGANNIRSILSIQ